MKKLLYLLLFIPFGVFGQTEVVNVGASANDHTGDPLRSAFIKVNTNFSAVRDSFGNIYRESQVDAIVHDTITLNTALTRASTMAVIQAQIDASLASFGGSGGGSNTYTLSGKVGDTGFPAIGDSLVINTGFVAHPSIFYFGRDGNIQQQHVDNTQSDGFWFDQASGVITVRPVFGANEQIIIKVIEPIVDHQLVAEGGSGGGGLPSDTPLLDSLLSYYALDEAGGVIINDALGVNNGTTTAQVNQTGRIGKSELFNGTTYATIPYSASLLPQKDEMTFGCWFNLTSLPSTAGHYGYLARFRHGSAPNYMASVYITTTNLIEFDVVNIAGTEFGYETAAAAVTAGQWYYVACVNEGNGVDAKIYLGTTPGTLADITSYHPTVFSGDLLQFNSVISLGNHSSGSALGIVGYMDEVAYYDRALTFEELQELMANTYPFTP